VSYGAKDSLSKDAVRLDGVLAAAGIPHDVKVYPDAGHSFLNDHDPAEVPKWAVVMGKLSHSEFHAPSARDARRRIATFFDAHLGS
jgi:carboxymethylenebutenolidase